MAYNHLRNISNRYRHRDTQHLDLKERNKDAGSEGVNPTGTVVKIRTKPIKNIYVKAIFTESDSHKDPHDEQSIHHQQLKWPSIIVNM